MNVSQWTLESELNQLAGRDQLVDSLRTLGLVEQNDGFASLETISDWYRSGAETYGLHFAVTARSGRRYEYFMKACVAYAGGTPLKAIFADWLSRRATVEGLGVGTPKLYATGSVLLVEEYVPYTLTEALKYTHDRATLLRAVGVTVAHLVSAGFAPLSAHDWRSRRSDVILVDFGQDLGPDNMAHSYESGLLSEVLDNLLQAGAQLSTSDLQLIGRAYEEIVQSG